MPSRQPDFSPCLSHIPVSTENYPDNSAIYPDDFTRHNAVGILEVRENYVKIKAASQAGHKNPGSGGKRGNVTQFSHGSRTRMIQRMASLPMYPRIWQDFTFADDTMRGLTESERAAFSSECVRKFQLTLKSVYRGRLWGIWRREWARRGSGSLRGQRCPHFHVLLDVPGFDETTYRKLCLTLATLWVRITGTQHPKAGSVARHEKSYRWLKSVRMAQAYVSKCASKVEVHKGATASLGRFWGRIGTLPEPIIDTHYLSAPENVLIRRLLRAYAGRRSTHLKRILQTQTAGCWILISRNTINRMMAWVHDTLADHPPIPTPGCPALPCQNIRERIAPTAHGIMRSVALGVVTRLSTLFNSDKLKQWLWKGIGKIKNRFRKSIAA